MTVEYARQHFPALCRPRPADSHKGSFGTVGIIGGAPGMAGAALLAGRAALMQGAGKVKIGFVQDLPFMADPVHPELMLERADTLLRTGQMTVCVAGMGMGLDEKSLGLLYQIFRATLDIPLVLDADGLTLLAQGKLGAGARNRALVLTPHPQEAARLLDCEVEEVQQGRARAAVAISKKFDAWTVLKGHKTVICSPQGDTRTNNTGNPGLASGGTGDVLAGMLGACLAQGVETSQAVSGAVWLHGAAADLLVNEGTGPVGLTATDVLLAARRVRNSIVISDA
ncbi:NAD(P)H-hydrate dehydratase [Advenella sp. S44]|uniref:NAD(P)H-hydrate dehydratase n=1 Tax=Advenella sp. S44 TaxID=1982755 RepID=UPI000C29C6B7|nr:NAD(P)H-hydrate dehydratase [Advenella sp. S44]PJX25866.1 NAD(P)H-hydrate dehydratase [Advenella sp. S44]